MALVQWKQISPQLGDYGQLTGSLEITGSFILNGQELDLAGGVVSSNQTLSIDGYELSISNGNTITLPQGGGSIDTGSLIISASSVGNSITFTYGNGSTETITIDTGSTLQSTDISALNSFTSSYFVDSASFDSRIQNISIDTGSLATDAELLALSASAHIARLQITGSTVDTSGLLTTASYQIDSASFDSRIAAINVSGDTAFNGDRVVSNVLLGDLYNDSFNAGTTGSIQDFLTAVFFPSAAPTATFTEQTNNFNTNLATTGTNLNSIAITDTVDDSPYIVVINGTNGSSFTPVPVNADSSSWEIQAATDLSAGSYTYDVTVTDKNGASRTYSNKTLTIAQATTGTLTTNGTFYIIESATLGPIYLNSNGRTGTQAQASVLYSPNYGTQAVSSFTSSNPLISIASDGKLSVGNPISGSGNLAGSVISSNLTWEDQYGNVGSGSINVNVAINSSPAITETNITNNLNTNLAVSGANLVTISYSDIEGDAINYDSFTFSSPSANLEAVRDNTVYRVRSNNTLSAGTYEFTSSIADVHGFRTTTETHTFNIAQASSGTLTGDTNIYIIESALSGSVFRDATGFNNGSPADLDVSYVPNYGSQIATFTSSNAAIAVNNDGNLTLAVDLSGSVTQSGATFNTTITWNDQYGNQDTAVVTATVFGNQAPAASFTDNGLTETTAISGSDIGILTVTDIESNSPFIVALGGTDGDKFNVSGTSSPFSIQPTGSLSIGDYSIQITVTDNYGEQAILNETISVASAIQTDTIYVYTLPIDGTYDNVSGITGESGDTPPVATIATSYGFFNEFVNSNTLGDSTINVSYGSSFTATLKGAVTGSNVDEALNDLGGFLIGGTPASERIYIIIPSGSNLTGIPTSTTLADPGTSNIEGEYVLFVSPDGTYQDSTGGLSNDVKLANIHKIALSTPVNGYTDWFVVGTEDRFQNANAYVRLVPSSGSIPT